MRVWCSHLIWCFLISLSCLLKLPSLETLKPLFCIPPGSGFSGNLGLTSSLQSHEQNSEIQADFCCFYWQIELIFQQGLYGISSSSSVWTRHSSCILWLWKCVLDGLGLEAPTVAVGSPFHSSLTMTRPEAHLCNVTSGGNLGSSPQSWSLDPSKLAVLPLGYPVMNFSSLN